MTRKIKKHNTIFDDVFRTMVQKMPQLLIPVINEVFHTNYQENTPFEQLRNEHVEIFGKIITDSIIKIGSCIYHIECQSTEDSTMTLRMIEYDFAIALEDSFINGTPYEMNFPDSCILYLRKGNELQRTMNIRVNLPDGQHFIYKTKAINLQNYSCDEIFEKKLLFFLPYYIMRYEEELPAIYKNENRIKELLCEYENIRNRLSSELSQNDRSVLYTDLIALIHKIASYIVKSSDMKRKLSDVMGGKVLELESERLIRLGKKEGIEEGIKNGIKEGLQKGIKEGKSLTLFELVTDELLPLEEAAKRMNLTTDIFLHNMKDAGFDISKFEQK